VISRRTEWFVLAFGSWGRCRPPDDVEKLVRKTDAGDWWAEDGSLERLPKAIWEEDTKPGG
jgi:hypothetical protein